MSGGGSQYSFTAEEQEEIDKAVAGGCPLKWARDFVYRLKKAKEQIQELQEQQKEDADEGLSDGRESYNDSESDDGINEVDLPSFWKDYKDSPPKEQAHFDDEAAQRIQQHLHYLTGIYSIKGRTFSSHQDHATTR